MSHFHRRHCSAPRQHAETAEASTYLHLAISDFVMGPWSRCDRRPALLHGAEAPFSIPLRSRRHSERARAWALEKNAIRFAIRRMRYTADMTGCDYSRLAFGRDSSASLQRHQRMKAGQTASPHVYLPRQHSACSVPCVTV